MSWPSPRVRGVLRRAFVALGLLAAGLSLTVVASADLDRARFARPRDAVTVTDRHGVPLRHHREGGVDRRWVSLDEISPHLVDAVIAVEDQRFEEHAGVDLRASARAAFSFVLPGRRLSGASTLTQQLVKLVYGRPSGLFEKPREIVRALRLEQQRDKDWILEQYLNRLPYADQVVGVGRASELTFGVPVSELTVAQAALLAGVPQAPSALDPRRHPEAARRRQRLVLARMLATGRIDAATHRAARAEPLRIASRAPRPWRAPRAADAALEAWRAGTLPRAGGRVGTSLDLELDAEVDRLVHDAVMAHRASGVENGAAVVIDNASGEILAYVGAARREEGAPGAWLDLLRARRQPGSTLKPFIYELLFERGGTAATQLDDLERPMVGAGGAIFTARDYDGRQRGPVLARDALAASLNLAALDAARRVGPTRIVARLRALGLSHVGDADDHGAAVVLGGADVTALELAAAYATIARGGTYVPLRFGGDSQDPLTIMQPDAAAIVRDVLMDPRARREGFGDDLEALFGRGRFGLKTGTSSGWRDAWTAVFTDRVTVVVWLGDPGGRALSGLSGFAGAAPVAVEILALADARHEALGLAVGKRDAPPLAQARVCAHTGLLAGSRCTHARDERFAHGTVPTATCAAHRADGAVELAPRYARWLAAEHPAGYVVAAEAAAETEDAGRPRIAHPSDGARLLVDGARSTLALPLRATVGGLDAPEARWEVDGAPHEGARWRPEPGPHVIVAVLGDRRSDPVSVEVARY